MDVDALFEVPEGAARLPPPAPVRLTPGEKLRERQAGKLARGVHPLSMPTGNPIRLHPGAAPAADRDAAGLRCGSCRFRELLTDYHATHCFPKCVRPGAAGGQPRATHSAASDVRAWWPACVDYEPKEDA